MSDRGFELLERWWSRSTRPPAHPFATPLWTSTWWDCFGDGGPLRAAAVSEDGGSPRAVLPLSRARERCCGIPLAGVGVLWNAHVPRTSLLVDDPVPEVCRELWRRLRDDEGEWDVLRLCQIAQDDELVAERLAELAADDGYLVGRWPSSSSPYVPVQGSWQRYEASLTAKFRSSLRRRMRLLGELGAVDLETIDGSEGTESLNRALDDAFRLEGLAWKARAGSAILSDPREGAFYCQLAHRAAAAGWLRLRFLNVGGRRVAAQYSLLYRNTLFFLKGGYDPELSHCSPSNLLLYLVLRDAHEQRFDEVDLLGDAEPWKLQWTPELRRHHWLFIHRPSLRARLAHHLKFGIAPKLRSALGGVTHGAPLASPTAVAP